MRQNYKLCELTDIVRISSAINRTDAMTKQNVSSSLGTLLYSNKIKMNAKVWVQLNSYILQKHKSLSHLKTHGHIVLPKQLSIAPCFLDVRLKLNWTPMHLSLVSHYCANWPSINHLVVNQEKRFCNVASYSSRGTLWINRRI